MPPYEKIPQRSWFLQNNIDEKYLIYGEKEINTNMKKKYLMVVGKEKYTMVTHIHVMLAPPRDLIVSGANMRATNITAITRRGIDGQSFRKLSNLYFGQNAKPPSTI